MNGRPNVLVILTDQQQYPPPYESAELAAFRREHLPGVERLRQNGVSFRHHYPMATACAPSRASLLTGQYPSLHGVTQTDGIAKTADGDDMFWLAPDSVPTLGDWFRAGGYRTYYKGKWHASHPHLDADDGDGLLQSIEDDGTPIEDSIKKYLTADLLDDYGFSEWVGPEPHGLGKRNTGTVKDPFTADETIALLKRLDAGAGDPPWLAVCSFLNPHDDSLFGVIALKQGLRFHPSQVPHVDQAPTRKEDLSTKPSCQQSYVDNWATIIAPQPWNELHLKFYYQMQAEVGQQIERVLDALRETEAYENTIVIFSSDHGDMQGAHGGMHEKWHVAYEEALHVPFIVSSPLLPGGARELNVPTNHADLIPTLLGLASIDPDQARARLQSDHSDARPLVGRDLSQAIRAAAPAAAHRAGPLHHRRRDQRGQCDVEEPVRALRPAPAPLLDRQAAQPPANRYRRGRRRRCPAPGQVLPLLRQPAVLDRTRRARRAPARTVHGDRHRARTGRIRALRPHPRPHRGTKPRPPQPRRQPHSRPPAHDARAPGRAGHGQAPDTVSRRGPRLPPARSLDAHPMTIRRRSVRRGSRSGLLVESPEVHSCNGHKATVRPVRTLAFAPRQTR
jgi:arylsulfatase A-like enzyme